MTAHNDSDMLAIVSDPTTPGRVLVNALRFVESFFDERRPSPESHRYRNELHAAILRNPNLPTDLLRLKMADGYVDAWLNPSAPLSLLEDPMPDDARYQGLLNALIVMAGLPTYYLYVPGQNVVSADTLRDHPAWPELCAAYPDDIRHLVHGPF